MRRPALIALALAALACTGCATALTGSPNHLSNDAANLVGKVVTDSAGEVEFWVEYGPTSAYGSQTTPETQTFEANTPTSVTGVVSGLERSTLYHYRFCARDDTQQGGPGCGEDRTFTTQSFDCGETVTSSVQLTADYLCHNEAGLVVGAAGIEIDLAGHRFDANAGTLPNGPRGIDNSGGFDDVTVRNGTMHGWGEAVFALDASRNRVLDVAAFGILSAVAFRGGDANEVRRSELFGELEGLLAIDSVGLIVAVNEANSSTGPGIRVVNGDLARIVRNRVERSSGPSPLAPGIELIESQDGRIAENKVLGPWSSGGIFVGGAGHVLVDNQVSGGKRVAGDTGPSSGDGIHVSQAGGAVLLRRNDAQQNEGDGIDVRTSGSRLEDNQAFSNGGIGILAVPGVIDLGGNSASLNGGPAQCVNVFCP
jgi:parallel beta-helix repeat protein